MHLHKAVATLLLISFLSPLFGLSVGFSEVKEDPNSSLNLLKGRVFDYPLSEAELGIAADLEFSLATVGKGEALYEWFGHSGIIVTEKSSNRSVMYDFGIFSFDDNFYQTYALGNLNYEVWATSAPLRIKMTVEENRYLSLLTLNLSPSAKLETLNLLNFTTREPNNIYLYHHYRENCATRIRDIIDGATDGKLQQWAESVVIDETLRQLVDNKTDFSPLINWTLNFLQSGVIDKPITYWDAMFLPSVLEEGLIEFSRLTDIDLANTKEIINQAPQPKKSVTLFFVPLFALAVSLISLYLFYSKRKKLYSVINFVWSFCFGLLSCLLLFMMVMTNHDVTYFNENIIFASPFLLVAAFILLIKGTESFRVANTAMLFILIAYIALKFAFREIFYQNNIQIIVTFLPLYLFNSSLVLRNLTAKEQS